MNEIRSFRGSYAFLSNFWPNSAGVITVEHLYQAAKTTDPAEQAHVLRADTPGGAKRRGRRVTLRPDWDDVKLRVMGELVPAKFEDDPELAARLQATGDATLIEGNHWHDNFWGDCDHCKRPGANHLGLILMDVRLSLR